MPGGFYPTTVTPVNAAFGFKGAVGAGNRKRIGDIRPSHHRTPIAINGGVGLKQCALFYDGACCLPYSGVTVLPAATHQYLASTSGAAGGQVCAILNPNPLTSSNDATAVPICR